VNRGLSAPTGSGPKPVGQGTPDHAWCRPSRGSRSSSRWDTPVDGPAGIPPRSAAKNNRQREHAADRDTAEQAACRDDHPSDSENFPSPVSIASFWMQDETGSGWNRQVEGRAVHFFFLRPGGFVYGSGKFSPGYKRRSNNDWSIFRRGARPRTKSAPSRIVIRMTEVANPNNARAAPFHLHQVAGLRIVSPCENAITLGRRVRPSRKARGRDEIQVFSA